MFKKFVPAALAAAIIFPLFANAAACPNLTRNLSFGSRSSDVVQLQQFLISQNLLVAGSDTGYFGRLTQTAVQQFQCRVMNLCSGSPSANGYGVVGQRTRSAIANTCMAGTSQTGNQTNLNNPSSSNSLIESLLAQIRALRQQIASLQNVPPTSSAVTTSGGGGGSSSGSAMNTNTPANTQTSGGTSNPPATNPQPPAPSCAPLPAQTQTLSCPPGQIGTITQTRASSCPGPTWSAWQTLSNSCTPEVINTPTAPSGYPFPHFYGQSGSYYFDSAQDLRDMFALGMNLQMMLPEQRTSALADSQMGPLLRQSDSKYILKYYDDFPVADYNRAQKIQNYKSFLDTVKDDPHVVGFWIQDDYTGDVHQNHELFHQVLAEYNQTSTIKRATVCGFGGFFVGGEQSVSPSVAAELDKIFSNFTPQGCDLVGLYLYSTNASTADWTMKNLLSTMFQKLRARGWAINNQPLIAIPQTYYSNTNEYVQPPPTAAQITAQIKSFCDAGATAVIPFTWAFSSDAQANTLAVNNTPAFKQGIIDGLNYCRQTKWRLNPPPTGTFTASGCTIAQGQITCGVTYEWTSMNANPSNINLYNSDGSWYGASSPVLNTNYTSNTGSGGSGSFNLPAGTYFLQLTGYNTSAPGGNDGWFGIGSQTVVVK